MKLFASMAILFFSYSLSSACMCINYSDAQRIEILKKTSIVFQGEVLSVSDPYAVKLKNSKGVFYGKEYLVDVSFKVIRAWKGVESSQITVQTYAKSNSCSIPYQVGMKPTVLANGKTPRTDYCTAAIIDFNKIPEILGEGKVFKKPQSQQTQQPENKESFWAGIWNSINSFSS